MDKRLRHSALSLGSYKSGDKSGKQGSSTKRAHSDIASGDEEDARPSKSRKSAPRCVVCAALASTSKADPNKIAQSVWYCQTCQVHLCMNVKTGKKVSCFDRFHNTKNLSGILKNAKTTPKPTSNPTRTSPRRKEVPRTSSRTSPRRRSRTRSAGK